MEQKGKTIPFWSTLPYFHTSFRSSQICKVLYLADQFVTKTDPCNGYYKTTVPLLGMNDSKG